MLDKLDQLVSRLRSSGKSEADIIGSLKKLLYSPAVALVVKLTPNSTDDMILELLKSFIPAPA